MPRGKKAEIIVEEQVEDNFEYAPESDELQQTNWLSDNNQIAKVSKTADSYTMYDQRTHVYEKADVYIMGDTPVEREEYVFDNETKRMILITLDFVVGCERIFLEIASNAADNVGDSRRAEVDPGKIEFEMTRDTITITNYGMPMPVEFKDDVQMWVPEMLFGRLLTSSNYNTERHQCGTNGIGSKATNIFSKNFDIVICDAIRKKKYSQSWSENMKNKSVHHIEDYKLKKSSVRVSYKMDFERFGYQSYDPETDTGGYPPEAFALFLRHAIDISFNCKVPIVFNGETYNYSNIRDYARLFFGDVVDQALIHYQWPDNTEVINKKRGFQVAKNAAIMPTVELLAVDTPDEGCNISFVNSMMTPRGGVHVDAAVKAVTDGAVKTVNEDSIKQLTKLSKNREVSTKDKRAYTINIANVRPHLSMLLSVRLVNPKFESNGKGKLNAPKIKIEVPEDLLKGILKWDLINRLHAELAAKQFKTATKSNKKKYEKLKNVEDANQSKSKSADERLKCVLYVTEGNSAAGYANKIVALTPTKRAYIGVLPMRGKSLNVTKASQIQIDKNIEIMILNKTIGLIPGTDYTDDVEFRKLKYGSLMIMADSDVDGKHITALIVNYFHCKFPSLLARGFVLNYMTPIRSVKFNRVTLKFYSDQAYELWESQTPNYKKWEHNYYKGLGSSNDDDIKSNYLDQHIVQCIYDEYAPQSLELAFADKLEDQRKEWISDWERPLESMDDERFQNISYFIYNELVKYSLDNLKRAIPSLIDGLKESQRKILFGAHKQWKICSVKTNYKKIKVAQFGAHIAKVSKYHHGELILGNVIVAMAQDFIGTNNLPYFEKEGQFGSLYYGGKDAANTRYSHTMPTSILKTIYNKKDLPILKPNEDEGEEIEPEHYLTTIPMVVINGCQGIGTGWSTFVPNHNPLDVIAWIRARLAGQTDIPMFIPWYRNFAGEIEIIDRKKKKRFVSGVVRELKQEDLDNLDSLNLEPEEIPEEFADEINFSGKGQRLSMVTYGRYDVHPNGDIIITSLPIGRWPIAYLEKLKDMKEKKIIKDFDNNSADEEVYFLIKGFKETPNYKNLHLIRSFGLTNMTLLNEHGRPVKHDSVADIMETFYIQRLPFYQKRKDHMLTTLEKDMEDTTMMMKFVQLVVDEKITVVAARKAVKAEIALHDIPEETYKKSSGYNYNQEGLDELAKHIEVKRLEHEKISATSAEQMWLDDLDAFEVAYRKIYKISKDVVRDVVRNTPKVAFPKISELKAPVRGRKVAIKQPSPKPVVPSRRITLKIGEKETTPKINSKDVIAEPIKAARNIPQSIKEPSPKRVVVRVIPKIDVIPEDIISEPIKESPKKIINIKELSIPKKITKVPEMVQAKPKSLPIIQRARPVVQ